MSAWAPVLVSINIYIVLATSFNIAFGWGGLLSLCQAAFYAVGAYAFALLTVKGVGCLAAVLAACLAGSAAGLLVGLSALRLRRDYFVLGTMGFQALAFGVIKNWDSVTNGAYGIGGIPKPVILGWRVADDQTYSLVSGAVALSVLLFHWQLARAPFGRALRAVRDDEFAAMSLGKNPGYFKAAALTVSGATAALAGALFAGYARYIDPTSFGIDESAFIAAAAIVGGTGDLLGPVAGAILVVALPEALRYADFSGAAAANLRLLIYGVVLVFVSRFWPQGLAGFVRVLGRVSAVRLRRAFGRLGSPEAGAE